MIRLRRLFIVSLLAVWVGMMLACGGLQSREEKADALWDKGDKAGAIREYKEAYDGWFVASDKKVKMLPRIVEFETAAGNADEAKKWIRRGLDDKLSVEYTDPKQKELFTAVAVQKDKDDFNGIFVTSTERETMLLHIVEYEAKTGNKDEAKAWIKRGLDKNLKVESSDPAVKELFTSVKKEWDDARAKAEAEAKEARAKGEAEADRKKKEAAAKAEVEYDADGLILLKKTVQGTNDEFSTTITGTVVNRRDKKLSYAQITFNVYNANGAQVGTALANINGLEPGGRWDFKAVYLGNDGKTYKFSELSGF